MTDNKEPKRKALGRGLSALISAKPVSVTPTVETTEKKNISLVSNAAQAPQASNNGAAVQYQPTGNLMPSSVQPRQNFNEAELKELAQSIKGLGILQPILVRKSLENSGKLEIIAGERRWRAAQLAELSEVPVIIRDFSDEEASEVAIIENIQRSDLNPMEEAEAYQALIDNFNLSQQQVADKVGKDRSSIANLLRVLSLPPEVQTLVRQSKISLGHAKALLAVKEPVAQKNLAQKILNESLTVRELEGIVSRSVQLKKPRLKKESNLMKLSDFPEANDRLRQRLGTRTNIQSKSDGSGKISIDFFSNSDLDRIIELICE
jgi:ParB family chromosome partitioning protein